MIAIVDYGVGNLFSLGSSLKQLEIPFIITYDEEKLAQADQIILPGVGAFGDAIARLGEVQLIEPLRQLAEAGKPLLGICLGMQLLFDSSEEFGQHEGLGLIGGTITSLQQDLKPYPQLKVPHIGWNELIVKKPDSPLLKYTKSGDYVYYVHSYYATNCAKSIVAVSDYGVAVPGIVQADNVFGTQFHPEKSGEKGLEMLRAFSEVTV